HLCLARRAPGFHRLGHVPGHVGQESAELVAGPRASRTPPRLTPPTTTSTIPTTPHTPAAYTGTCRGGYGRTEQLLRRRGVDGLVIHRLERHQPVERAHQLAHVGELESRHGVEHARLEPRPPLLGLAAQD